MITPSIPRRFRRLVILNLIEDAQDFLRGEPKEDRETLIISTHGAVDDYLGAQGRTSFPMASLNSYEFIRDTFIAADEIVAHRLSEFDRRWSKRITGALGLADVSIFAALYSYTAKYEYLNLRRIIFAMESLLENPSGGEIILYRPHYEEGFFDGETHLTKIVQLLGYEHGLSVALRRVRRSLSESLIRRGAAALKTVYASPQAVLPAGRSFLADRWRGQIKKGRKTALLFGSLYDLSFLRDELTEMNIVRMLPGPGFPKWLLPGDQEMANLKSSLQSVTESIKAPAVSAENARSASLAETLLEQSIIRDFRSRAGEYLMPITVMDRATAELPITAAITGQGPSSGAPALVSEYFLRKHVPVVAMQHGATYGTQRYYSCHFDLDYNRCSHYLSYGFDKDDLAELHPGRRIPCTIIPVGSVKIAGRRENTRRSRRQIDILYPFANSWSIMIDVIRNKSDTMTQNQQHLLDLLDSWTDMTIAVKAFPHMVQRTCSIMMRIKRLKHAKLHRDYTTNAWLKLYEPRAIIIDFPSTPLFEVLDQDCEIFLLLDPLIPFGSTAQTLLEKRVHCYQDYGSLEKGLARWKAGTLPRLRDDSFLQKYIIRPSPKETILRTLREIME